MIQLVCASPLQKHAVDFFLWLLRLFPLQFSNQRQLPLIKAVEGLGTI